MLVDIPNVYTEYIQSMYKVHVQGTYSVHTCVKCMFSGVFRALGMQHALKINPDTLQSFMDMEKEIAKEMAKEIAKEMAKEMNKGKNRKRKEKVSNELEGIDL